MPRPLLERMEDRTLYEPNTGCWIWLGARNPAGYGKIGMPGGKTVDVHRATYEALVGPVPAGYELDHLCKCKPCRNPAHLEPVTRRENVMRGTAPMAAFARQTHCKHGHEFTEANTRIRRETGRTMRICRACDREASRRRRAR